MISRGTHFIVTVICLTLLSSPIATAESPNKLPSGTQVHFIVRADTPLTIPNTPNGESGDVILFTGKSVGLTDLGICAQGDVTQGHVQSATVVDPGDHRPVRLANSIVVTAMNMLIIGPTYEPVPAGTRVILLGGGVHCYTTGQTEWIVYQGVVD
jgi:hypothetical protein